MSSTKIMIQGSIPKIGSKIGSTIWDKLFLVDKPLLLSYKPNLLAKVYYSRKVNSFLQVLDFVPKVKDGNGQIRPPSEFKELQFSTNDEAKAVLCCFNSSLFRWFIDVSTDGSHLNRREVDNFPFNPQRAVTAFPQLIDLALKFSTNLRNTSENRLMKYKHDTLTVQCIIPKHSKHIIDEIDRVLAQHYGFTDEELDFIINYDIKYRMGRDAEQDDDSVDDNSGE